MYVPNVRSSESPADTKIIFHCLPQSKKKIRASSVCSVSLREACKYESLQ